MESTSSAKWPRVHRIANLEGGLKAINLAQETRVRIFGGHNFMVGALDPEGSELGTFELQAYGHFFTIFERYGLRTIGLEFIEQQDEAKGIYPSRWRAFTGSSAWNGWEAADQLSMLSHAFFSRDMMLEWDLARRLDTQVELSELRLHALWETYGALLNSQVAVNGIREGHRFENGWNRKVAANAHALFTDLATWRDFLCEFVSILILKADTPPKSAAKFLAKYKGRKRDDVASTLVAEFGSDDEGSLKELGAYRDLIVHSAPLSSSTTMFLASVEPANFFGSSLPVARLALPRDVAAINSARSKGLHPPNRKAWIDEGARPADGPDCLIYLHSQFKKLAGLTLQAVAEVDMKPERVVLTDADLIGRPTFGYSQTV
jgi:hypothetical protein